MKVDGPFADFTDEDEESKEENVHKEILLSLAVLWPTYIILK